MSGPGPVIPAQLLPYNSYQTDPQYQLKFTIAWASVLGFFVLRSSPRVVQAVKRGRGSYSPNSWLGIKEETFCRHDTDGSLTRGASKIDQLLVFQSFWKGTFGRLNGSLHLVIPSINLDLGQIILLVIYIAVVIFCIIDKSQLIENGNRAGFLALAQLPIVYLFAAKNSVVSALLGPGNGYEKLNFIHRWSGRVMFAASVLHGALWIKNHLRYNLQILGQQKEESGIVAFTLLSLLVLTSLLPVRRYFFEIFFILHRGLFITLCVAICYHTPYAIPWIYAPLAFYGLDILLRMLRLRFKDALLVPIGNQMTLVHIPHATSGWLAGQHIRLRIFFSSRLLESHPFTVFTATPDISCITSMPPGISFGVRATGDWSKALNTYANEMVTTVKEKSGRADACQPCINIPIQIMLDGPYGGSNVDLGDYETILLFAGGSGITFTLGLLDDIVGRCVRKGRKNGEKTKRIEFAWCIKSFGQIDWFSSALMDITSLAADSASSTMPLYLHISIYVTCLCNPDAVPLIQNCHVTVARPSVYRILTELITPLRPGTDATIPPCKLSSSAKSDPHMLTVGQFSKSDVNPQTNINMIDEEDPVPLPMKLPWIELGGGVAVCASGPESLTTEAANAVSRIKMTKKSHNLGEIALHTELFSL